MTPVQNQPRPRGVARTGVWAAALLLAASWNASAWSAPAKLPADLDLVPRDAAAFFHFRVADLWKTDVLADVRHFIERAGPEAMKTFKSKCVPDPATIDRVTVVALTPRAFKDPFPSVDPEAVSVVVIVRTNKPYNRLKLMEALEAREKIYNRNKYYFYEELWSGLVLVDELTFVIGTEDAVIQLLDMRKRGKADGPLQAALLEAAGKHHATIGLNPQAIAKETPFQGLPAPFSTLLDAHCGTLTLSMDKAFHAQLRLDYQQEDKAKDGEKALKQALDMARQGLTEPIGMLEKQMNKNPGKVELAKVPQNFGCLLGLGVLREVDTLLKEAVITRKGNTVTLPFTYQRIQSANMYVLMLAGVSMVGVSSEATFRQVGAVIGQAGLDPQETHMKKIAEALEKYHADKGTYPPAAIYDKDGRPVLSWRVALLPYLGEEGLYKEFRLNEPWDSLYNKKLLKRIPKAFQQKDSWRINRLKTADLVFTGPTTIFTGKQGTRKADIDKLTILLASVDQENAIYWTKPLDLPYQEGKPLPKLTGRYSGPSKVMLLGGEFRSLDQQTDEKTIRNLIKRSGPKEQQP